MSLMKRILVELKAIKIKIIKNLFKNDLKYKKIGKGVYIAENSIIKAINLVIGDYTTINGPITIKGNNKVIIGKYCALGSNIKIISENHNVNFANIQIRLQKLLLNKAFFTDKSPVIIGNNVWIGDDVIILTGAKIGNGAVIGAGSIVTKPIPPFSVAVGVPARVIKMRFKNEIIEELLKIKWWEWSFEKLKCNKKFFEVDLTEISIQSLKLLLKE